MKLSNLYFLSILYVAETASRFHRQDIIEGEDAEPGQFLYQVAIICDGKTICGGGIIGDHHILTAAHCVIDNNGDFREKSLTIVAGTIDLDKRDTEGVSRSVHKIYVPTIYDAKPIDSPGDIAVLKLDRSLGIDENPNLIELKLKEDREGTYDGEQAKIAGFGWDWIELVGIPGTFRMRENGGIKSSKLRYLKADILSMDECRSIFANKRKIHEMNICARSVQAKCKESGICKGDSGGPLVYNDETVIGVVSTSPYGCSEARIPAVYTRVSSYIEFIENCKNDQISDSIRQYTFQ